MSISKNLHENDLENVSGGLNFKQGTAGVLAMLGAMSPLMPSSSAMEVQKEISDKKSSKSESGVMSKIKNTVKYGSIPLSPVLLVTKLIYDNKNEYDSDHTKYDNDADNNIQRLEEELSSLEKIISYSDTFNYPDIKSEYIETVNTLRINILRNWNKFVDANKDKKESMLFGYSSKIEQTNTLEKLNNFLIDFNNKIINAETFLNQTPKFQKIKEKITGIQRKLLTIRNTYTPNSSPTPTPEENPGPLEQQANHDLQLALIQTDQLVKQVNQRLQEFQIQNNEEEQRQREEEAKKKAEEEENIFEGLQFLMTDAEKLYEEEEEQARIEKSEELIRETEPLKEKILKESEKLYQLREMLYHNLKYLNDSKLRYEKRFEGLYLKLKEMDELIEKDTRTCNRIIDSCEAIVLYSEKAKEGLMFYISGLPTLLKRTELFIKEAPEKIKKLEKDIKLTKETIIKISAEEAEKSAQEMLSDEDVKINVEKAKKLVGKTELAEEAVKALITIEGIKNAELLTEEIKKSAEGLDSYYDAYDEEELALEFLEKLEKFKELTKLLDEEIYRKKEKQLILAVEELLEGKDLMETTDKVNEKALKLNDEITKIKKSIDGSKTLATANENPLSSQVTELSRIVEEAEKKIDKTFQILKEETTMKKLMEATTLMVDVKELIKQVKDNYSHLLNKN